MSKRSQKSLLFLAVVLLFSTLSSGVTGQANAAPPHPTTIGHDSQFGVLYQSLYTARSGLTEHQQPISVSLLGANQDNQVVPSDLTVYITETGNKYHRSGCRSLAKSSISISLDDAKRILSQKIWARDSDERGKRSRRKALPVKAKESYKWLETR